MSDRDWELVLGRLIVYRVGRKWTLLWRSCTDPYSSWEITVGGKRAVEIVKRKAA